MEEKRTIKRLISENGLWYLFYMERDRFNPSTSEDLPDELIKELNLTTVTENQVLEVFREGGGILNISEVLVGFYKIHNEVKTRRHITSILHRMKSSGFLKPTGKKGEYSIQVESDQSGS